LFQTERVRLQVRGPALPVNAALVLVAGGLLGQIYNNVQLTQVKFGCAHAKTQKPKRRLESQG